MKSIYSSAFVFVVLRLLRLVLVQIRGSAPFVNASSPVTQLWRIQMS